MASHQRDVGQAAGTVMRLPGYFRLQASVLPQVLATLACIDRCWRVDFSDKP